MSQADPQGGTIEALGHLLSPADARALAAELLRRAERVDHPAAEPGVVVQVRVQELESEHEGGRESAAGSPVLTWHGREGWVLTYTHDDGGEFAYEVMGGPEDVSLAVTQAIDHLRRRTAAAAAAAGESDAELRVG